jgi:phosphatidylinositol 4-kinase
VPTLPGYDIVAMHPESARVMTSHARTPVMVEFTVAESRPDSEADATESPGSRATTAAAAAGPPGSSATAATTDTTTSATTTAATAAATATSAGGRATFKVAVILKTNDDCRQDQLALQLIGLFGRIFRLAGLPMRPTVYDIVTTSPGAGVIHVVPNAMSRDRVGRLTDGNLAAYLRLAHGPDGTAAHTRARTVFAESLAAYSVISYILQVKDRHNGNLLLTDDFGLVHIDFGFLFDSSPGGNFKFERAAFKLTREYLEVIGAGAEWNRYETLVVRGFLAARDHREEIVAAVAAMAEAGFGAFTPRTLGNLEARFVPLESQCGAAAHMRARIVESLQTITTGMYDRFQAAQNGYTY